MYRALAASEPALGDQLRSPLAEALFGLARAQSDLAQWDAAAATYEEAAQLRRLLVKSDPSSITHLRHLIAILNNLGNCHFSRGQNEAALATVQEALRLQMKMAQSMPGNLGKFGDETGGALHNIGTLLCRLGRTAEAEEPLTLSVKLLRESAVVRPSKYRAAVGMALTILAFVKTVVDKEDEALRMADEAVAILSSLAEQMPDVHREDLAKAYSSLCMVQLAAERNAVALDWSRRAVQMLKVLVVAKPAVFAPHLAEALQRAAVVHQMTGHMAEAAKFQAELARLTQGPGPRRHA